MITCVSDLHGDFPQTGWGDVLIVAGDLVASSRFYSYVQFIHWLSSSNYKHKVFIAGNHDTLLQEHGLSDNPSIHYLCDSGIELEGIKIWGSPWVRGGMDWNPHCKAFCENTDEALQAHWDKIPEDTDVLITHSPPFGLLDAVDDGERCGSVTLLNRVRQVKPTLHVFGHIHEGYGSEVYECDGKEILMVNAAHMDKGYNPVNSPINVRMKGKSFMQVVP